MWRCFSYGRGVGGRVFKVEFYLGLVVLNFSLGKIIVSLRLVCIVKWDFVLKLKWKGILYLWLRGKDMVRFLGFIG